MIGISSHFLVFARATALHSVIIQTTGTGDTVSMLENRCMHAAACLLRAGQVERAVNAADSGQFVGQFSWDTGVPYPLEGY